MFVLLCFATSLALLVLPFQQMKSSAQADGLSVQNAKERPFKGERISTNDFDVVRFDVEASRSVRERSAAPFLPLVGTDQGSESEPNGTCGTADALTGSEGKIRGQTFPVATDVDWYSFTAPAGAKVYTGTVTSMSAQGADTVLDVFAADCTTILETDDEDGTFGGSSSSIAGTTLAAGGTYYLRVTNFSTTSFIVPYDLYFAVRTGAPTAETEPNNNGTPQALPASGYVSGAVDPVGDTDTFSFSANAGDTIVLSQDLDPERDVTNFNGRIGLGLFGTPTLFLVTGDGGTFDTIDSEAFYITVRTAGTYQIYVDSQTAGQGGPTATYNFNVMIIPAASAASCTTYTNSTSTPIADLALTTSSINIPDSRIIRSAKVVIDLTHTNMPDLDVHLRSPANNDNGLFTDIGAASQTGMNEVFDDAGAIPPLFAAQSNFISAPELSYRLDWLRGENSLGTWNLDIRDDLTANSGTLNSWSVVICEEPAVTGTLIYSQDFELNNGSYTHSGTADEWEYGTPATAAQTGVSPFIAAFTTCASGTNCWKTDLDNTYEISSNQDLVSPAIVLPPTGVDTLYWQSRYQLENVGFDRIWVSVTEVANPTNTRIVWHNTNATMGETNGSGASAANLPESAGWGRYSADISDFAGLTVQITFHLQSDSSINYGGWAIDDVQIRASAPTAAPANINGRITRADGSALGGTVVRLGGGATRTTVADSNGNYHFDGLDTGSFYSVTPVLSNYTFSPANRSFTLSGNITDAGFTANPDATQTANAIDMTEYFVRQQYLDFLGREPDAGGLAYWSDRISSCGNDAACISQRRIDVSAAFFRSDEFQATGSYVYGIYAGTLGRTISYNEFTSDRAQVPAGPGLDAAKTAFAANFVQRAEFTSRYPAGMTREEFVDAVLATMSQRSGVSHSGLRAGFLSDYDSGGRALVVRHAAEAADFVSAEFNQAFVLMEYFGYLRRPEDQGGYLFWLDVLNRNGGDHRSMVCSFLTSTEYQHRFSSVVTRTNAECGP
jgi:subtilisin-like proprotein convertase family protein